MRMSVSKSLFTFIYFFFFLVVAATLNTYNEGVQAGLPVSAHLALTCAFVTRQQVLFFRNIANQNCLISVSSVESERTIFLMFTFVFFNSMKHDFCVYNCYFKRLFIISYVVKSHILVRYISTLAQVYFSVPASIRLRQFRSPFKCLTSLQKYPRL